MKKQTKDKVMAGIVVLLVVTGVMVFIFTRYNNHPGQYVRQLDDSEKSVRMEARKNLIKGGELVIPSVEETLKASPHPTARKEAAIILGYIGSKKATGALINALDDPNPVVTNEAAVSLIKIGDDSAVTSLKGFYEKSKDPLIKVIIFRCKKNELEKTAEEWLRNSGKDFGPLIRAYDKLENRPVWGEKGAMHYEKIKEELKKMESE